MAQPQTVKIAVSVETSLETLAESGLAVEDYPFNDDLLFRESDRIIAAELYPNIYPALDHPELRERFAEINNAANTAKRRSRRLGFAAVGLVTVALFAASAEQLHLGAPWIWPIITRLATVAGIIGAGLGFFGILFARSKRRWLEARLCTERMRQFHFQTIIAWLPDILAAAEHGNWATYIAMRRTYFERFQSDIVDRKGPVLDATLSEDDNEADGGLTAWLVSVPPHRSLDGREHMDEFLRMFNHLRIQRQIDFARFKLRTDHRLLSEAPKAQASRITAVTIACVSGIIAVHAFFLAGFLTARSDAAGAKLQVLVLWLAIAALALRTLEEGLQPRREVERYRNYRSGLQAVRRRFVAAHTTTEKLAAMRELEELSFDEMVNFLKSNHEAKFVM